MLVLLTLAGGLFLSAFFSGSETGFYRVPRVRLLMDAKSGKKTSRWLLWLAGRPTLMVATVLIGNNIANYLVSFGLVLASQSLFASWGNAVQTFLPVLATPFLFTYGELLPKYLFYNAPYQLSTRSAPLMVACTVLFLPISILVMGLEAIWNRLSRSPDTKAKFSLERQELQRVMLEGQEAGVVLPVQQELTQNLFTFGIRPIRQFAWPQRALPAVREGTDRDDILRLAERTSQRHLGVLDDQGKHLIGCYAIADLLLFDSKLPPMLPVQEVKANDTTIHVLASLQAQGSPLARIVDARGVLLGLAVRDRLTSLLLADS